MDINDVLEMLRQEQVQKVYARNMAYANPDWHTGLAQLGPEQEQQFLQWVKANKVPFNPNDKTADYDMRGFWQALQQGDPRATSGINPYTQSMHYPDEWKTPYHESFSASSQWAAEGAPSWIGDTLTTPSGEAVFQDKKEDQQE